jgi:hypothetical protein
MGSVEGRLTNQPPVDSLRRNKSSDSELSRASQYNPPSTLSPWPALMQALREVISTLYVTLDQITYSSAVKSELSQGVGT